MRYGLPSWKDIIYRTKKRGKFLPEHRELVGKWETCATGEYARKNGLNPHRVLDNSGRDIFSTGLDFTSAVANNNIQGAVDAYKKVRKLIRINFLGGKR